MTRTIEAATQLKDRRRILMLGCSGAGKSTLARQFGNRLRLPVHHLDALFWQPGWVIRPKPERLGIVESIMSADSWIIDGNYDSTMVQGIAGADAIVVLDFTPARCIWRVLKRRFSYHNRSRVDRAEGCREKLDLSHLWIVARYPRTKRPLVQQRVANRPPGTSLVTLRSPGEVTALLQAIGGAS